MKKCVLLIAILCLVLSCKKDLPPTEGVIETSNAEPTNSVMLNVTNVAGNSLLTLGTQTYVNENLDTFSVSMFRYYISNIKLFRLDGFIYSETESYHLLSQDDTTTCKLILNNVPLGDYIGMEFIIGVDSLRNCDGAQTGALDPLNDMFWDWSQGYIFAKMEGTCNKIPGSFFHHVGGFTGPFSAIVKSTPSFNTNLLKVNTNAVSKVYLKADVLEWFKNPSIIDLSIYTAVGGGKTAKEIADNYSNMFSVVSIKN